MVPGTASGGVGLCGRGVSLALEAHTVGLALEAEAPRWRDVRLVLRERLVGVHGLLGRYGFGSCSWLVQRDLSKSAPIGSLVLEPPGLHGFRSRRRCLSRRPDPDSIAFEAEGGCLLYTSPSPRD